MTRCKILGPQLDLGFGYPFTLGCGLNSQSVCVVIVASVPEVIVFEFPCLVCCCSAWFLQLKHYVLGLCRVYFENIKAAKVTMIGGH